MTPRDARATYEHRAYEANQRLVRPRAPIGLVTPLRPHREEIAARRQDAHHWEHEIAGYLLAFIAGATITYTLGSLYLWRISQ